jgi:hypothetical protein
MRYLSLSEILELHERIVSSSGAHMEFAILKALNPL